MIYVTSFLSGNDGEKVTPVPIPNTEVKLLCADGSGGTPSARVGHCQADLFRSSSVVEQSAVNRSVAGSNPACGVIRRAVRVWSKEHDWKSCRRLSVSRVQIPCSPPLDRKMARWSSG